MSVMVLAGSLIGRSYERSLQQELEGRAANALEQIAMRMDAVFEASKAVSYDGVVRNSYRLFQRDGDKAVLYRVVTDYLKQNFTRDERVPAAFITFWEEIDVQPYVASRGDFGYNSQREYRDTVEKDLLKGEAAKEINVKQMTVLNVYQENILVLQVYYFTDPEDTDRFFSDHKNNLRRDQEVFEKFQYTILRGTLSARDDFLAAGEIK